MKRERPASVQTRTMSAAASSAGASTAASDAASVRTGSPSGKRVRLHKKCSPQSKLAELLEGAQKYQDELVTGAMDLLSGKLIGNITYQSRRVLIGLDDLQQQDLTDYVNLKAMLSFVEGCEKMCNVNSLAMMDEESRAKGLQEIFTIFPQVPAIFQANLCVCNARLMHCRNPKEIETWIETVRPWAEHGGCVRRPWKACPHQENTVVISALGGES